MNYKCKYCDKPAVVHEVTIRKGVKEEVHLCEDHAQQAGVTLPPQPPINKLLTQFVVTQKSTTTASHKKCPQCGTTFARFRQSGTLGCPRCYEAFEKQLSPLIERAQNGATHHRGKTPCRAGTSIDRQLQVQQLVKELNEAVASEQYERAAEIRDRLRGMDPGEEAMPGEQATGGS